VREERDAHVEVREVKRIGNVLLSERVNAADGDMAVLRELDQGQQVAEGLKGGGYVFRTRN
jgi:hypothetical protein